MLTDKNVLKSEITILQLSAPSGIMCPKFTRSGRGSTPTKARMLWRDYFVSHTNHILVPKNKLGQARAPKAFAFCREICTMHLLALHSSLTSV